MSEDLQEHSQHALALPVPQQRDALLPLYREIYSHYNVDWDRNTQLFADDFEVAGRGSMHLPGLPERVEGRDGYVDAHLQLIAVVDVLRVDVDDLIPLGDGRVVVLSRFVLRAGGSQIDQQVLELHEFGDDGLLRRQYYWFSRDEGFAELGLSR